ncbi:MAG: DNRLRE domain-containing protein, partial [Coprococcus sp.]|nr:DNRLRE domain-containing protein [Coprococcus sp.]
MSKELINSTEMREDVTKRTACMKVFEHADHSFTAAIYGTPVHYMKDGRWEEIDNRLEAAEDEPPSDEDEIESEESTALQAADSGDEGTGVKVHAVDPAEDAGPAADDESAGEDTGSGDVANIAGSFHVRLSNKVKKKNMVRLGEGETKLTWGFVDARSVKRQILKSADDAMNAHAGNADPTAAYEVSHLESRVLYPEAFGGVDIRYTIGPDRLKEDLVLKHAGAVKAFTWRYAPGKLRAVQEGADIIFKDGEGTEAYRLSAPYMTDAAGKVSRGLVLTLTDDGGKKNKEAYVRLEADGEWLGAEDRVYPVMIDPVVSTPVDRDKIRDCHVSSYYHGDNFYNSHLLKTGRVDGSTLRSYMKFELPYINRADQMITSAWLWLTKYAGSGSAARYIDVHKVTGSWNHKTLTWDNRPGYDGQVIDYAVYQTDEADQQGFDITNLVKDWYMNGKNYGLMVKDHTETGHYTEYASADIHEDFASLRPHILIQYVNYSGLESFWTYHSQSAGRAGTIHINDYTGNLILEHETFSLSGSRLPVGLSHVYNSSEADGKDLGYGRGFRLDCHQTIARREIGDTVYYAHTEGDGTVHYFAKDDKGEWKDELGLGQKLTFAEGDSEARYTITDKSGTKLCFAEGTGLLTKIVDANNNTQRITWSGGKVTKVTDPTSRAVALVYDSSGHLVTVKTPSGQEKKFAYDSSGHLTGITDADGAQSTYTYDGNHMLKGITDPYGYHLYVNWVRPEAYGAWRVSAVLEKAGGEEGMRLGLDYGYNRTKFTDEKGRSQYYLFDNSGHTVSVRDDNGYGAAWEFASRKVSRLSAASDLQFTPVQRLKGTFDGLKGWNGYGSSSAVKVDEETDDDIVFVNKKCIRFTSSDASAYGTVVQTVMLPAGRTYVFSVYGRAAVTELGEKPSFWLQAQKEDQTEIARHTENIRGNRGWKRMQLVFKIPSGSTPVKTRIVVRAVDMKGTLWLDGFQLEEGEAASRFNLLTNVDFSNGLDGFKKAGNSGDLDRVVTLSVDSGMYPPSKSGLGRNVFMAVGGPSENKRLVYELDISGNAGDCYMASAWGRGQSVPRTVPDTDKDRKDRHFGLCINFYDGEAAAAGKNGNSYQYLEFGADTDSWQYLNGAAVAKQKYTKIQVMYLYNRNANRAYFTGLSFFKERYGNTFVYDDEGNIVRATDKAKKTSSFEYDSSNNMKKLIDAKGNAFKYDYDSRHNVTKAKSGANKCYTFVYDTYGNPLTARTVNPAAETDAKKAMTSRATYISGGQYMATQTAPEGMKIAYEWDVNRGQLKKTTDASGQSVSYAYDTMGKIIRVSGRASSGFSEADIHESYTYEKDRLTKIRHHGCDYTFAYDGFGNGTEVAIAGTKIISHSYGERNGLLTKSLWGNGWEISYSYDSMDRLTGVTAKKDGTSYPLYTQAYNRQGLIYRYVDQQESGRSCTYGYDLTGRLCEAVFDDGTAYSYTYDANDCLVKEHHTIPGGSRDVIRAYDKDSRETSVTCGSAKVEKAFDELGRLSSIKRNGGKHVTEFTY